MNEQNNSMQESMLRLVANINKLKKKLGIINRAQHEPIAIIGMSCRFPGGVNSIDAYWNMLSQGIDAIKPIPKSRFDASKYYDPDPDAADKMYATAGGFMDEVDKFDANFFGISPREALAMDPQQRLLLKVSWEALEQAGQTNDKLIGSSTGVFVGMAAGEYQSILMNSLEREDIESHIVTGISANASAGRLAYVFGLQGPAITIDTACSSSLVSTHLACQSLRDGDCNMALACGVNVLLSPEPYIWLSRIRALAFDGHCKTFDKKADGYARGEGCGVLILKRLSDAIKDGDKILATIRGSAVNQDGMSNSFTAPNGKAQEKLIKQALKNAQIYPKQISYIEAHGTGTPLGDPIEVQALTNVFKKDRVAEHPLIIGTVKTNIGHTESAAGVAGIIKTVLAMQHKKIPKHLNFTDLNDAINLSEIPAKIPTATIDWDNYTGTRIAGVSSFGISGTNAHVVLEEYVDSIVKQDNLTSDTVKSPESILCLSAKSNEALIAMASKYLQTVLSDSNINMDNICYSTSLFKNSFDYRLAVVADSKEQFKSKIQNWLDTGVSIGLVENKISNKTGNLAFMFTGQGSQYVGMGKDLYQSSAVFKKSLDECAEILANDLLDKPLLELLWGDSSSFINETKYTQPVLFAFEYALCQLWISWGIIPQYLIGHSVGEYVAATVAGVFSLTDGLKLIVKRAALMQSLPQAGAMVAIATSEEQILNAIKDSMGIVSVAAVNGPFSVVISGDADAVRRIASDFSAKNIKTKELIVSHAFHSHLLEPMLQAFEESFADIKLHIPNIAIISNITGKEISSDEVTNPKYWVQHTRNAVRFSDGIKYLFATGVTNFIEIGPHPVLLAMTQECLEASAISKYECLPSMRKDLNAWQEILLSLGRLYIKGYKIDWGAFYKYHACEKINLPAYPFQEKSYMVTYETRSKILSENYNPLLGWRVNTAINQSVIYEAIYNVHSMPLISEHKVYNTIVIPAMFHISRLLNWAVIAEGQDSCLIKNLTFDQAIVLEDDQSQVVQLVLNSTTSNSYDVNIYSTLKTTAEAYNPSDWSLNTTGSIEFGNFTADQSSMPGLASIQKNCNISIEMIEYNKKFLKDRYQYGPGFVWANEIWCAENGREALGYMRMPTTQEVQDYLMPPGLIDCCFQLLAACDYKNSRLFKNDDVAYIPISIGTFTVYSKPQSKLYCYVRLDEQENTSNKLVSGDMILYSEKGEIIASSSKFTAIEAPKEALLKFISKESNDNDLLYNINWQPWQLPEPEQKIFASQTWLIFMPSKNTKFSEKMLKTLDENNIKYIAVFFGASFVKSSVTEYTLSNSKQDMNTLFDELSANKRIDKIIYLWSHDAAFNDVPTDIKLLEDQNNIYAPALYIAQNLTKLNSDKNLQFIIITNGAQAVTNENIQNIFSLSQTPLWGLSKVIALELSGIQCIRIDLDPTENYIAADTLVADIVNYIALHDHSEDQLAIRDKTCFVARLEKLQNKQQATLQIPNSDTYQILFEQRGSFDNLQVVAISPLNPAPNEVVVKIHASGLNFRDVMNVLGVYPGEAGGIGGEGAGEIVALGAAVKNFNIGDKVYGLGTGCLASHAIMPSDWIAIKPDFITYEGAATIPLVFATAYYGFKYQAKLIKGERVLIHAGAGGIGLAAIQLAQGVGAEIFVTVGNDKKRKLMESLGISSDHIFNSRNLEFSDDIMRVTNNEGIDVVLNSLAGEFIPKSISLLRENGRFIEIGKTGIWTVAQVTELNPNIAYFTIALDHMMNDQPELVGNILRELYAKFAVGELQPLPQEIFSFINAINAFRFMAQGKHIGKVVISQSISLQDKPITIKNNLSYLITGGLGGLGLLMAKWLAEKGAKYLLLTSRSAPSDNAKKIIEQITLLGVKVIIVEADISRAEDVAKIIDNIVKDIPTLGGIIHAAGILDDGLIIDQTYERYLKVITPKMLGAWNLQEQIVKSNLKLEFFISFSAAAALFGNPGQSNYAAANIFLDMFSFYQRQHGIQSISINWGPWSEIGMAAKMTKSGQQQLSLNGVNSITPEHGIELLEQLLNLYPNIIEAAVLDMNWQKFLESMHNKIPSILKVIVQSEQKNFKKINKKIDVKNTELINKLTAANSEVRYNLLSEYIESELKHLLMIDDKKPLDRNINLATLGMDSLMSVELRNKLSICFDDALKQPLPGALLYNYPTIKTLSEYLLCEGLGLEELSAAVAASSQKQSADWLIIPVPRPEAKQRLFCFLYLGGGVETYYPWANNISEDIELCIVKPYSSLFEIVGSDHFDYDFVSNIMDNELLIFLQQKPFSVFGHSIGTAIAYAFIKRIKSKFDLEPENIFLSSYYSPDKFGDTFKSVQGQEFDYDLVIPKNLPTELTMDTNWIDKYKERIELDVKCFSGINTDLQPIENDIYMFWGLEDHLFKIELAYEWKKFTNGIFELCPLNGGHFDIYLPENQQEIIKTIQLHIENKNSK